MSAKPSPSKPVPKPEVGRWRIMRGDVEVESYATEEMARKRFYELSRTVAGEGTRLVRPDGTDV